MHNLLFGIALIFLIQWVFLGNLRCALIVAATIPVALLLAVMITVLRGESAISFPLAPSTLASSSMEP